MLTVRGVHASARVPGDNPSPQKHPHHQSQVLDFCCRVYLTTVPRRRVLVRRGEAEFCGFCFRFRAHGHSLLFQAAQRQQRERAAVQGREKAGWPGATRAASAPAGCRLHQECHESRKTQTQAGAGSAAGD
ncbi:hypothetical protein NDU88_002859 [Pleurodeles waltl]|uniref:Uncharacterized protein n=1 Tax=Pleurodeles waltl TaxID=8319 RepID=A0AAV7RC72_PLEWA|nr:hypothetical protein NDU88_002859 [Pleurodeles waltl]